MFRNHRITIKLLIQAFTGSLLLLFLCRCSDAPVANTAEVRMGEIKVIVSTNGVIEPLNSTGIHASIDGFIESIAFQEGSEVGKGQVLFRMDAPQTRISLAEARASLVEAKRQARVVLEGPQKEELDSLDASIEEAGLQLQQVTEDLSVESGLLDKGAVSKESVERLSQQENLLRVRVEALKQKKTNILTRYSDEDKKLMQAKIEELTDQVRLLEQQVRQTTIKSTASGLLFELGVKPGAFVNRGQLLAQIYRPGEVRLRAYVDEPDLGRIETGQPVEIEWDGMPDIKWTGTVETPAERVVTLNNRSVGHVLCSIDGAPGELIPNINVKVNIITDLKANTLLVPRSAVFSREGKSAVLLPEGNKTTVQPIEIGLVTYDEIEVLQGLEAGETVITNPGEFLIDK